MRTQTEEQVKLTKEVTETELEFKVLTALLGLLYAEPGFSDVEVRDIAEVTGMKINTVKGVIGSFCKKQICYVGDSDFNGLIYLDRGYWFLHPEWCSQVEPIKR